MIIELKIKGKVVRVDLACPVPISLPLHSGEQNPKAWYLNHQLPKISPVVHGDWVGAVSKGASVNFNTLSFNPHAHGTHTECVGHIDPKCTSLQECLTTYFFKALVVTITPEQRGSDKVISKKLLKIHHKKLKSCDALIVRTLPNLSSKKQKNYDHSNWAYFTSKATKYLNTLGIFHLLVDLPSVDKEKDQGQLKAHKSFWGYPNNIRKHATITEFIYVPNTVSDGFYLLNLMVTAIENDASPSKPCIYSLQSNV